MFEFFRNLYWKNKRMVFECETMEELEEHYITRFENANNESIGSTQTETFVSNNQDMYARDYKILMARITTGNRPKPTKPKKLKKLSEEKKQEQSKAVYCPTVKIEKDLEKIEDNNKEGENSEE